MTTKLAAIDLETLKRLSGRQAAVIVMTQEYRACKRLEAKGLAVRLGKRTFQRTKSGDELIAKSLARPAMPNQTLQDGLGSGKA